MDALLATHIAGGFVALATGPVAMLSRKGGVVHVGWGRAYGVAMAIVAISSLALGVLRHREFLVLVGLFTIQLLVSGYRALRIRRSGVSAFDRGFQALALAIGVGFVAWGGLAAIQGALFGYIALVFGAISTGLAARWLGLLRRAGGEEDPSAKAMWLRHHLIGMGAAYLATATAALVVNDHYLPYGIGWLLPTVIGTPLIGRAARRVAVPRASFPTPS